jgi:hypothetical protein
LPRCRTFEIPIAIVVLLTRFSLDAQNRGVYPLGMSATNSGVTPESGFTYSNQFLFYARDEQKDSNGDVVATGRNAVLMDMNGFVWVTDRIEMLGGAKFSMSATIPLANNSLTSDANGPISGGGGLADSYYQPFILGWTTKHADIRAIYGFLAPTGRFKAGATDNVGSGYWTHVFASGQTFYLTKSRRTAISTFEMYEFHTVQAETNIHPGQTMNLDYSVTHVIPMGAYSLQLGFVGYDQWQTTAKTGPMITSDHSAERYQVHSAGFSSSVIFPSRRVNAGIKYFKEFLNKSTYQGYSLQISTSINF